MNRLSTIAWRLATVATGAALAWAAQADTGAPTATKTRAEAKQPTRWVQASAKHNGSGIRLRYSVPPALQAGQAASLQLQFSGVTAQGASAALRAPEGATLVAEDGSALGRVLLPAGQVTTLVLRIVPTGDGLQTIDVFTAQAGRSSAQSIPLKVGSGEAKLKAMGKVQTTPGGEKVISLPAQPPTK